MKLSIIVPVFNVEEYIEECIKSILKINILDMEVIIVNDGSLDDSIKIVNEFNDKRIKVINQSNKGLSAARNTGLMKAKGECVLFVDSDDYIINTLFIEKAINLIEEQKFDVIIGNGQYIYEKSSKLIYDEGDLEEKGYGNEEFIIEVFNKKCYQDMAWLNMYKKSFIIENNLYFKEGIYHEDVEWMNRVLLSSKSIRFVNEVFYGYRIRENSITTTKNLEKNINKCICLLDISKEMFFKADKCENTTVKNLIKNRSINLYYDNCIIGQRLNKTFYKNVDKNFLKESNNNLKIKIRNKVFSVSPKMALLINKVKKEILR